MPDGANWTGGRGRFVRKKAKRGLKVLEHGSGQHFAKRRVINYSLATQDHLNTTLEATGASTLSFKHAQQSSSQELSATRSLLPNILSRPNKPIKQPRLPGLIDTAARNLESLDTKRAHINALDPKSLVGLNKRKYVTSPGRLEDEGPARKRSFNFPTHARPRAFIASPSPERLQNEWTEESEEMLSFGTPSEQHSQAETQTSRANSERRPPISLRQSSNSPTFTGDYVTANQSPAHSSNQTEVAIPHTAYEDAVRAAARALKLPVTPAMLDTPQDLPDTDTPAHAGLDHRLSRLAPPTQDDSQIRAFNLFAPIPVDLEPSTELMAHPGPKHRLSDASGAQTAGDGPGNGFGNLEAQASSTQNRRGSVHNRQRPTEIQDHCAGPTLMTHGQLETEAARAEATERTHKQRYSSRRGYIPPSPFELYVHPSRNDGSQLSADQLSASSGVLATYATVIQAGSTSHGSNIAIKTENLSTSSAPAPGELSPLSSSQESQVSLSAGTNDHQTIGLELFNNHSGVEEGV